jgi:P27 family predicted phage terminase small subunit
MYLYAQAYNIVAGGQDSQGQKRLALDLPISVSMKTIESHIKEGTAKARHKRKQQTKPTASMPQPPEHLMEGGDKYWQTYCQHLRNLNQLQDKDLHSLADLCNLRMIMDQCLTELRNRGTVIEMPGREGLVLRVNPAEPAYNRALSKAIEISKQFGFTLLSGQRINASEGGNDNPDDDLFD